MNWKRLVQFSLLGTSELEQYAILLVRLSIGLFFAISGGNKLLALGGARKYALRLARLGQQQD